jgi:nitrite reductase/ring-hydroxylating ferredoxin subunit
MKIIILILLNIIQIYSYILPQTFREWTVIGIENKIDNRNPYHYKIGSLPMVLWYNKTNINTIINSCHKHIGNTLKDSYIIDNELICPFHKKKYTDEDNMGVIERRNGLLWWSYKSFNKYPSKIKDNNNNYYLDVKSDFITLILNFICDFNGDEYKFYKKKMLMKKGKNYLIYKYPYTLILNNNYMINIIPKDTEKSHIYITITKDKSINLKKIKLNIENLYNDFKYKFLLIKDDNSYISKIYNFYKGYMYPTDITIQYFIKNKRYY